MEQLNLLEHLRNIFLNKFSPFDSKYIPHDSTLIEMIYMATVPGAEKELHRSPPFPGAPILRYPASWTSCNIEKSKKEIKNAQKAFANFLKRTIEPMHSTTIHAIGRSDFYNRLDMISYDLERAESRLYDLEKRSDLELLPKRGRATTTAIPLHLARRISTEYEEAIGKPPTITVVERFDKDSGKFLGHYSEGLFIEILVEVFNLLNISASAESIARDVIRLRTDREAYLKGNNV